MPFHIYSSFIDEMHPSEQVQQVIRKVKRRLPPGYYDLESELDDEELEDEDGRPRYRLGHVPPKTPDIARQVIRNLQKIKLILIPLSLQNQHIGISYSTIFSIQVTDYDRANLDALCRGIDILPPRDRAKLLCFYSAEGNPYYYIGPLKVI